MTDQDINFEETNFEKITPQQASTLMDSLPAYEPLDDVESHSDHKLKMNDDLTELMEDNLPSVVQDDSTPAKIEVMPQPPAIIPETINEVFDRDFQIARDNIDSLIEKREDVFDELFALAKNLAINNPTAASRAFEVLGEMIDKFAGLSDKSVEIYTKRAKIRKDDAQATDIQEKTKVKMTTRELLRMMKQENGDRTPAIIDNE